MAEKDRRFRVLEFYSGVGGLRYSLNQSGVKAMVVEAFDINNVANDVYEHNFGHRPNQGNIQSLSARQLDKYRADAWLLSPPCQPYTRQGLQKDADDPRATSFLSLLQLLPSMSMPPTHLLVENVVGFENSVTHGDLVAALENAGLITQEFILSPLQFGIPYSRPRYFCLAKRLPDGFLQPQYTGRLLREPGPLLHDSAAPGKKAEDCRKSVGCDAESGNGIQSEIQDGDDPYSSSLPVGWNGSEPHSESAVQHKSVGDYLEASPVHAEEEGFASGPSSEEKLSIQWTGGAEDNLKEQRGISNERQSSCVASEDRWEPYRVPMSVVNRWIDASDVVTPKSKRCCCFTKSYSRYAKGTGSFLATNVSIEDKETGVSLSDHIFDLRLRGQSLASLELRYFTPREVANLHSFPENFTFPAHVKLKQRYALLGNSLSVAVVGRLIKYLFSIPTVGSIYSD